MENEIEKEIKNEWDGITERRKYFRRDSDGHCSIHFAKVERDNERHDNLKKKDSQICENVGRTREELKKEIEKMMPRWVMLWVGGPSMILIIGFVGWVSLKGISNTENIIEMKAEQRATSANVVQLMKHFDLVPVQPVKPK